MLLPWGLIGMVVLVAAAERSTARRESRVIGDKLGLAWRVSDQAARSEATRAEVLCFGDSLVKLGILPRVLEANGCRSAYYLLRHALDAGARPKAVLVDFHVEMLTNAPRTNEKFWPELLGLPETLELTWQAHDPNLLASLTTALASPSVRRRDDIRAEILTAFKGEEWPPLEISAYVRNWRMNRGATAHSKQAQTPDEPSAVRRRIHWQPYPVNAQYVRRFLDLAAAQHIPVFWLLPPLRPSRQERYEQLGVDESYTQFIRGLQPRYPNVVVLDGRRSGYTGDLFLDATHLDRRGAAELSRVITAEIIPRLAGTSPGPRWVNLPPFRGLPDNVAIEEFAQSLAAVRTAADRIRR
jgi:hypothetical protein